MTSERVTFLPAESVSDTHASDHPWFFERLQFNSLLSDLLCALRMSCARACRCQVSLCPEVIGCTIQWGFISDKRSRVIEERSRSALFKLETLWLMVLSLSCIYGPSPGWPCARRQATRWQNDAADRGCVQILQQRSGCTRVYPELTVKRCELVTGKIPALTLVACPNEYIYKPNDCYVWSCLCTDLDSSIESTFWREGRVKTLNNHERHLSEGRGNFLYPRKNSSSGKVNAPQSHTIC